MTHLLTTKQFSYYLKVIGLLAADVHEMHTIREHLATLPESMQPAVTEEVLRVYAFEASGWEPGSEGAFLDHLHTALGIPHLDIVRDLKRWAVNRDPRLRNDENEVNVHGYGYARESHEDLVDA